MTRMSGLVRVYGFKPADEPREPITGMAVTLWACEPGVSPPYPGISYSGNLRCRLLIQLEPGPVFVEKP